MAYQKHQSAPESQGILYLTLKSVRLRPTQGRYRLQHQHEVPQSTEPAARYGDHFVRDLGLSAQVEQADFYPREDTSMHVIPRMVQIVPIQPYSRAAQTSRPVLLWLWESEHYRNAPFSNSCMTSGTARGDEPPREWLGGRPV